jgi:hypothetical protein
MNKRQNTIRTIDLRPQTIAHIREQKRTAAISIAAIALGIVGYAIACFFQR